ncbi:hypothetical protein UB23_25105 [Pseudomonas sp. ES3-33]|nr:hypothetical protein UB23_25105 [Pseudomonas sp. ES3-33]
MMLSFDRKRGSAWMRGWKNWALSVAETGLPTIAGRLWICGDKSGKDRSLRQLLQISATGVGAAEGSGRVRTIF